MRQNFQVLFYSIFFATYISCSPKPNSTSEEAKPSSSAPKISTCAEPAFVEAESKIEMTELELKKSFFGSYELKQVKIFYSAGRPGTEESANLVARVELDRNLQMQPVSLFVDCKAVNKSSAVVAVKLYVPNKIHLPSTRMTIFDEGSQLDNPSFNFPSVAMIEFGLRATQETQRFQDSPKEIVGDAPYFRNIYLGDLFPKGQNLSYFPHQDGRGFDIRITAGTEADPLIPSKTVKVLVYREE